MPGTPHIRAATSEDIPGLVKLFARYYNQHKPAAYFEWQFFQEVLPCALTVAVDDHDDVVGSFGYMRRPLSNGLICGQVMDILLDENQRGKGIFVAMAKHAFSVFTDVQIRVVLSNQAGTAALTRALGWKTLARVPVYTKSAQSDDQGHVLPALEAFIDPLRIQYTERSENWRFDQHPLNTYYRLETASLHGYLKLFVDPVDDTRRFGDVLYVTSNLELLRTQDWLSEAMNWFKEQGAGTCGLWSLPGNVVSTAALNEGFTIGEQERWLCGQVVDAACHDIFEETAWEVCAADAEFY
jgi:hypothetical protein